MGRFCLECWNRINRAVDKDTKYIMSHSKKRCDGCGKRRRIILLELESAVYNIYVYYVLPLLMPFIVVGVIACFLRKAVLLPYKIYKNKKAG